MRFVEKEILTCIEIGVLYSLYLHCNDLKLFLKKNIGKYSLSRNVIINI